MEGAPGKKVSQEEVKENECSEAGGGTEGGALQLGTEGFQGSL